MRGRRVPGQAARVLISLDMLESGRRGGGTTGRDRDKCEDTKAGKC